MLQTAIEKVRKAKQFQQKLSGTCWKNFAANPLSSQFWLVSLSVWPVDQGKICCQKKLFLKQQRSHPMVAVGHKPVLHGCEPCSEKFSNGKVGATIVSNVNVSINEPLGDGASWTTIYEWR